MKLKTRPWIRALACGTFAVTVGCSSGAPVGSSGSGGTSAGSGGSAATGGATGSGGSASGGSGGISMPGTGGSSSTGGSSGTGGGSGGVSASTGGTTTGSGGGAVAGSGGAMGGQVGTGGGSAGTSGTGGATGGSNNGGGRSGSGGSAGAAGAGSGGQGGASSPAAELEGAGWTMKCGMMPSGRTDNQCYLYPPGKTSCPSDGYLSVDQTLHFGGTAGTTYDVTIRFQGTHEAGDYSGGTKITNQMLKGATHTANGPHTWLAMEVSAPAATYNPNSGGGAGSVQVYDYTATIQIQGGATIHLTGHDQDCLMHRYCQDNVLNPCKGLVVAGISPADNPIDGSFLNMHVMSVVAK